MISKSLHIKEMLPSSCYIYLQISYLIGHFGFDMAWKELYLSCWNLKA